LSDPDTKPQAAGDKKKKKRKGKGRELAECLLVAGALALGIRTFAFQLFKIPTRSMEPTLIGNEDYGDRVVAAMWYKRGPYLPLKLGKLDRWQVIVFDHYIKDGDGKRHGTNFIKRLVGLPGEKIEIRDGDIWVNGQIARKPPAVQERIWLGLCDLQPAEAWRVPKYWEPSANVKVERGAPAMMASTPEKPAALRWARTRPIDNRFIRLTAKDVKCPDPACGRFKAVFDTARPVAFCPKDHSPVWGLRDPLGRESPFGSGLEVAGEEALVRAAAGGGGDYWTDGPVGPFVPDLRLALDFEHLDGAGELRVTLTGRSEPCVFSLSLADGAARLVLPAGRGEPVVGRLPLGPGKVHHLEVANVDGAFWAELDGARLGPGEYNPSSEPGRSDAQVSVSGGARVAVSRIRLWRDIYYGFQGSRMTTISENLRSSFIRMPPDGYFFLGDNQLASADSREFEEPKTEKDIVARGIFVAWPPSRFHVVW